LKLCGVLVDNNAQTTNNTRLMAAFNKQRPGRAAKAPSTKVTALLVLPGSEELTKEVRTDVSVGSIRNILAASHVEQWPGQWQLNTVEGPAGQAFSYNIYVNGEGLSRGQDQNLCATLAAHPLNEVRGRIIVGPALFVSTDPGRVSLSLADWKAICQAVWYDDILVSKNASKPSRS
jgi:hypothetical protein